MLLFATCYKVKNRVTKRYDGPLLLFPQDPDRLKREGRTLLVLASSVMTPSLLSELLRPTERLAQLWRLAEARKDIRAELVEVKVFGYDLLDAIVVERSSGHRFRSYSLFGAASNASGLQQLRVRCTKAHMPKYLYEIAPHNPRYEQVANQHSFKAGIVLDRCIRCMDGAPLGEAKLCGRCLLLQEL